MAQWAAQPDTAGVDGVSSRKCQLWVNAEL